ncbi:MAG: Zn-dependent hydrolase of the beta-lactamase fold-like protein [uncultured bacterium]|nr:MAG: Zn-dependent hydrolase of the beta-lactamase fold-like protein [uncultured bacterium]
MQIQWTGLSSFRIETKNSVIITDPFDDSLGVTMPKLKADIVLVSSKTNKIANNTKRLSGDFMLIDTPGEYEIKQSFVYGVAAPNTIFTIEDEGMSLAFLGPLDTGLTNDQLETIEGVDILLVPIGTLSKEQRTTLISQVEPRIVIPYLYKQAKVKLELESLDVFLKEFGVKSVEPQEKYSIKKKDLPQEETTVIVLQSSLA